MTASLAKISAGTGYEYLTRQTVSNDTTRKGQALSDYYSEKGEQPGRWVGSALPAVQLAAGAAVTEEQMGYLFGEGMHPNAQAIQTAYMAKEHAAGRISKRSQGAVAREAQDASRLGQKFRDYSKDSASAYTVGLAEAMAKYNLDPEFRATFGPSPASRGEDPNDPEWAQLSTGPRPSRTRIPEQVRVALRTQIGTETFQQIHSRPPADPRELHAHIARESRPQAQAVSGYDVTFSPVKSVSVLWAVAPREVGKKIEDAHERAIADAMQWLEANVAGTRRGTNGVRSTDVHGVLATAFTHRDSRAGDPDLHTHVAISAKVQDVGDGQWRALDGAMLFKHMVAVSERYNSALEEHLVRDLGLTFRERRTGRRGATQAVREVAGVPQELLDAFSNRTVDIDAEFAKLSAQFEQNAHRAPTNVEALRLMEIANSNTRQAKAEPKSHAEQQAAWRAQANQVLGVDDAEQVVTADVLARAEVPTATLTDAQISDLAGQVVASVETGRARFQRAHIVAETERRIRKLDLAPEVRTDTVRAVERHALEVHAIRLDAPQEVADPAPFLRADGTSQFERRDLRLYATATMMAAEERIVEAAKQRGARVVDDTHTGTVLLESAANGLELNQAQAELVSRIGSDDHHVLLAIAPAGSGKTTSMEVAARAWTTSGGTVIGFGPSAVAARELRGAIDTTSETLAKLTYHVRRPNEPAPAWVNTIGADTLMVIDEAGMASTADLDTAIGYATARGAKVVLIGDDQQLSSVAAGGVLRDVAAEVGAMSLTELVRFKTEGEGAATLALRRGDVEALGFYLDQNRVSAVPGATAQDALYDAWVATTTGGESALMLAHKNTSVNELNARARADRIDAGTVDPGRSAALREGMRASAGDIVVTRLNDRKLRVTGTDFVSNGDRWTVTGVGDDGSLVVKHEDHGHSVTLPADYVAGQVDLGYAATVNGAQGQTVDHSYVMIDGSEDRQLLYVGMSRGRHSNRVFVPVGGDGDAHQQIFAHFELPQTAVETLEAVIRNDGSQVSARTEAKRQADPGFLLPRAAETYDESLNVAAITTVGAERMDQLTAGADQVRPGLTREPAWDTLAGHLAILDLRGEDPIALLDAAVKDRELDSARDAAAVLDWRLDTSQNHSAGAGPLPWLMGVPAVLAADATFGPVLTARGDVVRDHANAYADQLLRLDPADRPEWAHELDEAPALLRDVATWRAATRVPDEDRSILGPPPPASRRLRHYRALEERVQVALGPRTEVAAGLWAAAVEHTPNLRADPWSPVLQDRLALATAAGAPIERLLTDALKQGPLPDDHAAAALWSRLEPHLSPTPTMENLHGVRRLRPVWTDHLLGQLPDGVAGAVIRSPHWPQLVAAINDAARVSGRSATDLIDDAVRGVALTPTDDGPAPVPRHQVAVVLSWRVHDLVAEPPDEDLVDLAEHDLFDPEADAFATWLAAEREHRAAQARQAEHDGVDAGAVDHEQVPTPRDGDLADLPPLDEPLDDPGWADDTPWAQPATPDIDQAQPATADTADAAATAAPGVTDEELEELTAAIAAADQHADTPTSEPIGVHGTTRARVLDLTAAAERFYAIQYPGSAAQAHNTERFGTDLTDSAYVVGMAPKWSWTALVDHLRDTYQATDAELEDASLATWGRRGQLLDFFHDRAMFSIRDASGVTVGLIGRDLSGSDRAPKYKNTGVTPAFTKGEHLFGLYEATQMGEQDARPGLVRTEGTADAVAVTIGSRGALAGVAPLGTALTDTQADLLTRTSPTDTIWSATDNDTTKATNAGLDAAITDMTALADRGYLQRSLVVLPDSDPADMLRDHPDLWATILALPDQAPVTPILFAEDVIRRQRDQIATNPAVSVHAMRQITPVIAALPPEHWADTIDQITRQWPHDGDTAAQQDFYREQFTADVIDHALDWDPRDPRLERIDPATIDTVAAAAEHLGMDPDRYARLKEMAERGRARHGNLSPDEVRERIAQRAAENRARREQEQRQQRQPQRRSSRDDYSRDDTRRQGPSIG